jgi:hypothetical protein
MLDFGLFGLLYVVLDGLDREKSLNISFLLNVNLIIQGFAKPKVDIGGFVE